MTAFLAALALFTSALTPLRIEDAATVYALYQRAGGWGPWAT